MTTYTIDITNIPTIDTTNRIVPIGFVLKLKRTNLKTRYRVFEKDNNDYKEKTVNEEQKYPETLTLINGWNLMGNYFPNNNNNITDIYKYNDGYNRITDTDKLITGNGYWAYSSKNITFYDTDASLNNLTLQLSWNLISVNQETTVGSAA